MHIKFCFAHNNLSAMSHNMSIILFITTIIINNWVVEGMCLSVFYSTVIVAYTIIMYYFMIM